MTWFIFVGDMLVMAFMIVVGRLGFDALDARAGSMPQRAFPLEDEERRG